MNRCFYANLNGVYKASIKDYTGLHWQKWGKNEPLKSAKMIVTIVYFFVIETNKEK